MISDSLLYPIPYPLLLIFFVSIIHIYGYTINEIGLISWWVLGVILGWVGYWYPSGDTFWNRTERDEYVPDWKSMSYGVFLGCVPNSLIIRGL